MSPRTEVFIKGQETTDPTKVTAFIFSHPVLEN